VSSSQDRKSSASVSNRDQKNSSLIYFKSINCSSPTVQRPDGTDLEPKLQSKLEQIARKKGKDVGEMVNQLLRKDIEFLEELT
jgi:hypothetical protein